MERGDILNLVWNGLPYTDHLPVGFGMMAIVFKIFTVNEFWARFVSAASGICSVVAVYFLGKELFNRVVGFSAAFVLPTAFWFLYRSRSGDLDVPLTLFFTFYFNCPKIYKT